MKKITAIILLFFSFTLLAQGLEEKLTVSSLALSKDNKEYRVTFIEKAAFYKADMKLIKCLEESLKEKKAYSMGYDPRSLKVLTCKM